MVFSLGKRLIIIVLETVESTSEMSSRLEKITPFGKVYEFKNFTANILFYYFFYRSSVHVA